MTSRQLRRKGLPARSAAGSPGGRSFRSADSGPAGISYADHGGQYAPVLGAGSWLLSSTWLLLSIGLPLLLWWPASTTSITTTLAALILLVVSAVRLGRLLLIGIPSPIVFIFWFFVYVSGGVVSVAQAHTGLYPYLMDDRLLPLAMLIVCVAAVSFEVGCIVARRTRASVPRVICRTVDVGRLGLVTVCAVLASCFYILYLGGPGVFFESRRDLALEFSSAGLRDGSQAGSALLLTLGQIPIAVVLASWLLVLAHDRVRRTPAVAALTLLLILLNVVVNNPISNARYWFLTIAIGLLFCLPAMGVRLNRFVMVASVIVAVIAFPYSDYFRNQAEYRTQIDFRSISTTLSTKDFDQVVMTANGIWYVENFGHTFGNQLLGVLFFFVPRQIWPSKALDTGVLIGNRIDGAGTNNLSSPAWIEAWMDGSFPLVILMFVVCGYIALRLDRIYWATKGGVGTQGVHIATLLVPFLAGYSLILLRGPLLQAMARLVVLVAVIWVVTRWQDSQRKTEARSNSYILRKS